MTRSHAALVLGTALLAGAAAAVLAQQNMADVQIRTEPVAPGLHVLFGRGGNIGVMSGPDGVFLVDDQFAPLTDKIRAAVAAIDPRPIRFVLNTHWHGDHTGGNENLGAAGADIVAHDNVRRRMLAEHYNPAFDRTTPPAPPGALPVVTFNDSVTFHMNGERISVFHVRRAHTDGDAIVRFHTANVVHMGDCFFNGLYPFIDVWSGGSIDGMIATAKRILGQIDARTKLVPGHGEISDRAGLQAFHDMLVAVRAAVAEHVAAGRSLAETQAARPTQAFDAAWGKGFLAPDKFVEILYADLSR